MPKTVEGRAIRHVVEVRHESFRHPDFVAMAREHGVAIVVAGDSEHPAIPDLTAPFVYARIMGTQEDEPHGYPDAALERWAGRLRSWKSGEAAEGLDPVVPGKPDGKPRDVFLYVISGHKPHNPAAAMALLEKLA